jgi:hypothetical protein
MTALNRTAAQPAALDSGREPQLLSDEQLSKRIADIGTGRSSLGPDEHNALAEYVDLVMESQARIRDRLAELAYSPPSWLVEAIGERPAEPRRRQAWDRIAERSLRYRTAHGIPEDGKGLIGPLPDSRDVELRAAWSVCHRSVERDLNVINGIEDRGLSLLSVR